MDRPTDRQTNMQKKQIHRNPTAAWVKYFFRPRETVLAARSVKFIFCRIKGLHKKCYRLTDLWTKWFIEELPVNDLFVEDDRVYCHRWILVQHSTFLRNIFINAHLHVGRWWWWFEIELWTILIEKKKNLKVLLNLPSFLQLNVLHCIS